MSEKKAQNNLIRRIVMAVVGFIGNKMSDGAENALRARKHRNQPERKSESASLSERYRSGC